MLHLRQGLCGAGACDAALANHCAAHACLVPTATRSRVSRSHILHMSRLIAEPVLICRTLLHGRRPVS